MQETQPSVSVSTFRLTSDLLLLPSSQNGQKVQNFAEELKATYPGKFDFEYKSRYRDAQKADGQWSER